MSLIRAGKPGNIQLKWRNFWKHEKHRGNLPQIRPGKLQTFAKERPVKVIRHISWTSQFHTWTPTEILLRSQETRRFCIRNVLLKSIFSRQLPRRLGRWWRMRKRFSALSVRATARISFCLRGLKILGEARSNEWENVLKEKGLRFGRWRLGFPKQTPSPPPPPPPFQNPLKLDFHCRVIFTCVRT